MSEGLEENDGVRLDGVDRWLAGMSRRVGEPSLISGRRDSFAELSAACEVPRVRVTIHCEGIGADDIGVGPSQWLNGEIKLRSFELECDHDGALTRARELTGK